MAGQYIKDTATGRITKVQPATYTPNPERTAQINADTATVKRHARRAAFAQGITRSEYEASNRMRAAWEARAVADLISTGTKLHNVVISAYGEVA